MKVKRFGALMSALVLACAAVYLPKAANATTGIIGPFKFTTTAASGTIGPFGPQAAQLCSITYYSGGGATYTVQGAADRQIGGTYVTNTNFGTNGVITAPAAGSIASGNTAPYPAGFQMLFTGNTGTISGAVTCSGAVAAVSSLLAGTCLNIASGTISYNCPTPGPQSTPSPTATAAFGTSPGFANSGAWPYTQTVTFPNNLTQGVTVGNNSASTGTTANTYATLTAVSGTTGVSHGTNGNWIAYVTVPYFLSTAATSGVYGCVVATGATVVNVMKGNGTTACLTTVTNGTGGTPTFGSSTAGTSSLSMTYFGVYTIANSTAYSFTQEVASAGTTSITVFGFPTVMLYQN